MGGLPGAPTRDNLVVRALNAIRARVRLELPALDVTLEKGIPAAAGLGGGSSDAASALKLAQACWGIGLSEAEELALAAELGSDVPFFVTGASVALVQGRGERVSPLPDAASGLGLLLVTPAVRLAAADVFARYDELLAHPSGGEAGDVAVHWLVKPRTGFRDANDLWGAAASPNLRLPRSATSSRRRLIDRG